MSDLPIGFTAPSSTSYWLYDGPDSSSGGARWRRVPRPQDLQNGLQVQDAGAMPAMSDWLVDPTGQVFAANRKGQMTVGDYLVTIAGQSGGGSVTYGQDLSGTNGAQNVVGIQGVPVKSGAPGANGYVLTWSVVDGKAEWAAPSNAIAFGTDLSGTSTNQNVIGLRGTALPALASGYLKYDGASLSWAPFTLTGTAGGDLAGTYPNPTLAKIQGVTLPAPSGSNNTLKYDGTNLSWAAVRSGLGPNAAWATAHWYIDPVAGNDANNGTSSGTALKTYRRLAQLWDAYAPVLNSGVTVTFLSAQPDDTDRVFLNPLMVETGKVYLEGTPVLLATGTFTSLTAKSTSAADGRMRVNLGPGGVGHTGTRGLLLVNTTRSNSVATINQVVSGTILALNQPYASAALTAPSLPGDPVQHNDWQNGDAWALYQLPAVYVAQYQPVTPESGGFDVLSFAFMQHLYIPDPQGQGDSATLLSRSVFSTECVFDTSIQFTPVSGIGNLVNFVNCALDGGAFLYTAGIVGGAVNGFTAYDGCSIGGDTVVSGFWNSYNEGHTIGAVCVMAGCPINIYGSASSFVQGAWDRTEFYGTYTLAVGGGPTYGGGNPLAVGTYVYHNTAVSNFKGVQTFALDNFQVAFAEDFSVVPTQRIPNRGVGPSFLDTATSGGGFSGLARGYGGSVLMSDSIVPVSPTAFPAIGPSSWDSDTDFVINDSSAIHNLGSASLTVPRNGFLLVTACFHWNNLTASNYSAIYGIGTTSSAYTQEYTVIIPAAVPVADAANRSSFDGSLTYRMAVTPGSYTIHTLASQVSGTDANPLLCGADVVLTFSDT